MMFITSIHQTTSPLFVEVGGRRPAEGAPRLLSPRRIQAATRLMLIAISLAWCNTTLLAQSTANEAPVVKIANPLGVIPGTTVKVLLRGFKLDDAKEVKCSDGKTTAKVLSARNADMMNMQDPKRVGDRQVEVELTLPTDAPAGELGLVIVTPKGESQPYTLFVGGEYPVSEEKEANDGFRQAQAVQVPQIVNGSIHGDRNVDCFALEAQAGQKLVCEVFADRKGGNLDALLSLYNERGVLIASHDDFADSRDARLEVTLPAAGKYFLVLQDAQDLGGAAHAYRLVIRQP